MGADMVSFSGGKGVLGPQSTGILCGRADLMEAAYMNSAPNSDSIGRAAKVCKEEIAGLVTALEMFVDADHDAEMAGWRTKCAHIASALSGIPGVRAELDEAEPKMDEYQRTSPGVRVSLDGAWTGSGPQEIVERLAEGDPSVRVFDPDHRGVITVSPVNLQDGDEEILAERFRQVLTAGR
jgi:L-seryl-tRNA(Ser) seleniumtransferase